jgi:hypothetical protein
VLPLLNQYNPDIVKGIKLQHGAIIVRIFTNAPSIKELQKLFYALFYMRTTTSGSMCANRIILD